MCRRDRLFGQGNGSRFALDAGPGDDWVFAQVADRPGGSYDLGEGEDTDPGQGGDYLSLVLSGATRRDGDRGDDTCVSVEDASSC